LVLQDGVFITKRLIGLEMSRQLALSTALHHCLKNSVKVEFLKAGLLRRFRKIPKLFS
jgi:hypothetical protein